MLLEKADLWMFCGRREESSGERKHGTQTVEATESRAPGGGVGFGKEECWGSLVVKGRAPEACGLQAACQ